MFDKQFGWIIGTWMDVFRCYFEVNYYLFPFDKLPQFGVQKLLGPSEVVWLHVVVHLSIIYLYL